MSRLRLRSLLVAAIDASATLAVCMFILASLYPTVVRSYDELTVVKTAEAGMKLVNYSFSGKLLRDIWSYCSGVPASQIASQLAGQMSDEDRVQVSFAGSEAGSIGDINGFFQLHVKAYGRSIEVEVREGP